jgi:hypothetical protein
MGIMEIFKKEPETAEFYAVANEWQNIINIGYRILTLALFFFFILQK